MIVIVICKCFCMLPQIEAEVSAFIIWRFKENGILFNIIVAYVQWESYIIDVTFVPCVSVQVLYFLLQKKLQHFNAKSWDEKMSKDTQKMKVNEMRFVSMCMEVCFVCVFGILIWEVFFYHHLPFSMYFAILVLLFTLSKWNGGVCCSLTIP